MFEFLDLSTDKSVKIAVILFIVFIVINIVYLSILCIINWDITVPRQHPFLFALETILIGFGCSLFKGLVGWFWEMGREAVVSSTIASCFYECLLSSTMKTTVGQ